MSSSSAYNTVLLKSTVQAQTAAAPKRDFKNDHSGVDFNQAYNAVRDTHKKDEKITKSDEKSAKSLADKMVDKKTAVDNRKSTNDAIHQRKSVEKPDNSTKKSDVDIKSSAGEVVAQNKKLDPETSSIKERKTVEGLAADLTATPNAPQPVASATSFEFTLAIPTLAGHLAQGQTPIVDDSLATAVISANKIAENGVNGVDSELQQLNGILGVAADTTILVSANSITDSETVIVNNEVASIAVLNMPNSAEEGTAKAAAQIFTTGSLQASASTQKISPNTLTSETSETSEALPDSLAPNTAILDKASVKSNKDNINVDIPVQSDTQAALSQTQDPKSIFEKMLQTVARSSGHEETTPLTPSQSNATNSTHPLTDSLARFNDAQNPAARSFIVQAAIPVPVGQPQWSQAVGEKVLWLAAQNISSAEINLHPKDLGPMQVRVSVNQEQTSVSFTSHHPIVREVLDQNLNRLRDMFTEQGLNLVNVDVSDKSFSRQHGEASDQKGQTGANSIAEEESVIAESAVIQQRLVDHYA